MFKSGRGDLSRNAKKIARGEMIMSDKCDSCGQKLPEYYDLSETKIIEKAFSEYGIGDAGSWRGRSKGWSRLSDDLQGRSALFIERIGDVELINYVGGDYESEIYTQPIQMVLKVTQNTPDEQIVKFFKKVGEFTSFDGSEWDGPFTEVSSKPKTIQVWE